MNCDDYLSMLSTLPVEELGYGDARAHAATCRDCDRVTRVVAERERNMVMAYGEVYPPMTAQPAAAGILEIARRRRIAFFYRIGLGAAAVLAMFTFVATRRLFPKPIAGVKETFVLRCLSTEQALAVLHPVLSPNTSISTRGSSSIGIIDVTAPPPELQRVRSVLDRFDDPSSTNCGVGIEVKIDPIKVIVK